MISSTFLELIHNIALLLALILIYDMLGARSRREKPSFPQVLAGITLGVIGMVVMLTPWELAPGLFFDTRSVLLSISGLFFGTLPTMIAVLMTTALRVFIGGAGFGPGVGIIVTSGGIGLLWRHLRKKPLDELSLTELYVLGIVVHVNMLLWMFALPQQLAFEVLPQVGFPIILLFPFATAVLGWLMVNKQRRQKMEKALAASEHQLKLITDSLPAYVSYVGINDMRYRFVNSMYEKSFKLPVEQIVGLLIGDLVEEENAALAIKNIDVVRKGEPVSYESKFMIDGSERWINVNYVPDINEAREVEGVVVLSYDVTDRRNIEQALRESEKLLRTIAENYPNSYLSVVEKDFTIGYTAGREFKKQKLNPDDFFGLTLEQVFGEQTPLVREFYEKTFAGEPQTFELFINEQYQKYNTAPFYAEDGSVSRILAVVENITQQKQAEKTIRDTNQQLKIQLVENKALEVALREQAIRDPLTGLYNRRYMEEALQQEVAEAARKQGFLSIVMLDLDNLKEINDRYGHALGGDEALLKLVKTIQPLCRRDDVFCRYAGDEFILILPATSLASAQKRTLEWRDAVAQARLNFNGSDFRVTFSAGIAEYPTHATSGNGLIQQADQALYEAKKQGRDRVILAEIPEK